MTEQDKRGWFKTGKSRWHILISTNDVGLTACGRLYWNIGRTVDLDIDVYPRGACRNCLLSLDPAPTHMKIIKRDPK